MPKPDVRTRKENRMKTIPQLLAEELGCKEEYVNNVVSLLDEGKTIPFNAR